MAANSTDGPPLTEAQQEILREAANEGYFKVPRGISTAALAERQGMSDTELSQQLKRGLDVGVRDETLEERSGGSCP